MGFAVEKDQTSSLEIGHSILSVQYPTFTTCEKRISNNEQRMMNDEALFR